MSVIIFPIGVVYSMRGWCSFEILTILINRYIAMSLCQALNRQHVLVKRVPHIGNRTLLRFVKVIFLQLSHWYRWSQRVMVGRFSESERNHGKHNLA